MLCHLRPAPSAGVQPVRLLPWVLWWWMDLCVGGTYPSTLVPMVPPVPPCPPSTLSEQ